MTDHFAEAEKRLRQAEDSSHDEDLRINLAFAQVHATLALADAQSSSWNALPVQPGPCPSVVPNDATYVLLATHAGLHLRAGVTWVNDCAVPASVLLDVTEKGVPEPGMPLGQAVVERRNHLRMSQEDVANRLGPSVATLRTIETGRRTSLRPKTFTSLDSALGWPAGTARSLADGAR